MREAQALLVAGEYSGAYYLAGYAIECAIKACIAKRVREYDFPDKKTVVNSHSHDLLQLAKVALLDIASWTDNPDFADNWSAVKDWNEEARYKLWNERQARQLLEAIANEDYGILPWLKLRW